jgi:hypothetical protein
MSMDLWAGSRNDRAGGAWPSSRLGGVRATARAGLRHLPTASVVVAVLAVPGWSRAGECQVPAGGAAALAEQSDDARLQFVRDVLRDEAERVRVWASTWGAAYLLLTVGQIAAAPVVAEDERIDWWLGGVNAAVGVAAVLVLPLDVMDAGLVFAEYVAAVSPGADACHLLARGERWLELGAGDETSGTAWYMHAANVAVNLALALVLGFAFDHWVSAAVSGGVGLAIGEAYLLTQPMGLVDAWDAYRAGSLVLP